MKRELLVIFALVYVAMMAMAGPVPVPTPAPAKSAVVKSKSNISNNRVVVTPTPTAGPVTKGKPTKEQVSRTTFGPGAASGSPQIK